MQLFAEPLAGFFFSGCFPEYPYIHKFSMKNYNLNPLASLSIVYRKRLLPLEIEFKVCRRFELDVVPVFGNASKLYLTISFP